MILVISSPSSSTTGFWTTILLSAPSHHHPFQIDRPQRGVAAAFDKHDVGRAQAGTAPDMQRKEGRDHQRTCLDDNDGHSRILMDELANPLYRAGATRANCRPWSERAT